MKVRMASWFSFFDVEELFYRLYGKIDFDMFSDTKDVDLVVFSGGADISPSFYGEPNTYSMTNNIRDKRDFKVWEEVKKAGIPCFGICRGHQFLNAMMGGKLVQHIKVPHPAVHALNDGSVVNSYHHQGVISTPLNVIAGYKDIIEITKGEKIFSVQFHPEYVNDPGMNKIVKEGLVW